MVAIFPNLCLWRRSLCSNLGGIDPKKLYRATLRRLLHKRRKARVFVWKGIRKKYHFLLFLRIHNKSTTTTPKCTLPQRLVIKELKPMLNKQCNSLLENSLFISVLISLIITSLFPFLKMYKYFIAYR